MDLEFVRMEALKLALDTFRGDFPHPEQVVSAAAKYADFVLSGKLPLMPGDEHGQPKVEREEESVV